MFLVAYVLNASSVTPMGTVGEYRCIGSAGHSTVARSVAGSSHSKPAVPSDADRDFCAPGGRLRRNRRPGPAVRRAALPALRRFPATLRLHGTNRAVPVARNRPSKPN
jgi:hypothetical protein